MTKKQQDEDKILFQKAMQDVKPLICDKEPLYFPPLRKKKQFVNQKPILNQKNILENTLSESQKSAKYSESEGELCFIREGVQYGVLRKLKRNRLNIRKKLDLHGMTVPKAREHTLNFLYNCQHNNIRYACIIHGKGHSSQQEPGILKRKINQWLREQKEVLAFCSARESDGGTGALYVLIKRLRQQTV